MPVTRPSMAVLAALFVASLVIVSAAPALAAPPGEVNDVAWCAAQTDCLQWTPVAGASRYRVYRGETATLPCALSTSLDSCDAGLFATATTAASLVEVPAAGSMFWYLVTAIDGSGEGTPGAGSFGPRTLNMTGSCAPVCSPVGSVCGSNGDCCTDNCNGTCVAECCALPGGDCAEDSDCCGGSCAGGTCVAECTVATDCPGADTECATRTCTGGTCGFSYTAAGTPIATQVAGDCQAKVCDGAGSIVSQPENDDLPVDGLQCTNDVCAAGVPSNPPAPVDSPCAENGGVVCNGIGQCVECTTIAQCPGTEDDCRSRTCIANTCGFTFAPAGSPTSNQTGGDCQNNVCDGAGNVTGQPDDSDVPFDGSQCTSDRCAGGVPTFTPEPSGAPCAENGGTFCDGLGRCVQCLTPMECPGSDTECAYRTCSGGQCGFFTAPAGSPAATQTTGDCQTSVCDGAGNAVSQPDDADVPFDGLDCTQDQCAGGVPVFQPLPVNSPCAQNGGVVCNATGQCVQCNAAAQCPGIDGQCQFRTCTFETCGIGVAPPGTPCTENGGIVCDGAGTCVSGPQVIATSPANGSTAIVAATVSVTFSLAMNPATLTGQIAAGPCSGSIQVSLDDFASCVAFASAAPAMSAGDTVATLTPAPGLSVVRVFKIRVTTAAQSATGTPLDAPYTQVNGFTTQSPNLCDGSLVISQSYGAGGLAGSGWRNDFVELHNRGTSPVSVTGMSLQYASASGTTWLKTNLAGSIAPGRFYLVQLASGGAVGATLPTPDATGTTDISAANGKLALVSNQTTLTGSCPTGGAVLDFLGYGTANCNEGGSNAPAGSTTESQTRQQVGCASVDSNGLDFVLGSPSPRNGASSASNCACYVHNEVGVSGEADYCAVQFPASLNLQSGTASPPVYGQLYEAGVTEPPGASTSVRAQLGFGPPAANPQYQPGWTWRNASYNVQVGNNDEYQATFTAPSPGSYRYVYRFSRDAGVSWTYCDTTQGDGGAGSNPNLTFDLANQGVLTTTP